MLKIISLIGATLVMSTTGQASPFQKNCLDSLTSDHEHVGQLYFEFMDGGDEMYGGQAPISHDAWLVLADTAKCALAEKTLNHPNFTLKYPGTFSGPVTKDLLLLGGLDKIETFECDCMMVTSYTTLLDLPNLKSVDLDIFAHTNGYKSGEWSVFDALVYAKKTSTFRSSVDQIDRYRTELDLRRRFGVYPELQVPRSPGEPGSDPEFITEDFLSEHFSK